MEEYKPQFDDNFNDEQPEKGQTEYEQPGVRVNPNNPQYTVYIPYGFTPETYKEKKRIRSEAVGIGVTGIIIFLITFFWATVYYMIMGKIGYSPTDAYKFISEPAAMQCLQIALSVLIFTLPFIIVAKSRGRVIGDLVPLKKPKKSDILPYFLIGICFCAFADMAVTQLGNLFESFGINYSVDMGENPRGFFGFMLVLISTAVVPALVEEFACRGIVLGTLRKFGDGFAVITSAIFFGLLHGNFEQIPFAFFVGLVLAFITVKTGSLWVAVAVHSFNNLISVVFSYLNVSNDALNIIHVLLFTAMLLSGIIGACMIYKKGGSDAFKLENKDTVCPEKKKYKWFFTSPAIIILIICAIIESVQFFLS